MSKGFRRRQIARANELLYAAWHTEYFARCERLPKLDDLLRDTEDSPRAANRQTDEEMMAMARVLNAAFGGDTVEVYD